MQPIVLINQLRHTAMIVAPSGKNQPVIKLGKGKLTVSTLSIEKINTEGYIGSNYPPKLAHNPINNMVQE
tara:strand:- start:547 stop:756 length:210 start_codon:yes stop_codon:yes gene_type:complete